MSGTVTRLALLAKPGAEHTGVGRYTGALANGLRDLGLDVTRVAPALPPLPEAGYDLLQRAGMDARAFLRNFPVWARYPQADLYHLTSQNLASLLVFRRPRGPVVVTVHDIIPYLLADDPEFSPYRNLGDRGFDRLAMAGLRRADRLVADSEYTRRCLVEHLGIPTHRIEVIYLGVEHERFYPRPVPAEVFARYGLRPDGRYLIFVGSEHARKNLPVLVMALATVRAAGLRGDLSDVELIKVGRAHDESARHQLLALSEHLGIRSAIHFLDDVPEDELPLLYNLADVCVMPSLYEGFGLPVVEAMACGTPVICANATSLPELAGDAALLFDGGDGAVVRLAEALRRVLTDQPLSAELRARGLARAARFRWSETARQVAWLYGSLGVAGEAADAAGSIATLAAESTEGN